ncbi:MAG: hypothetical protein ACRCYP_03745 [Alphaproteobacteria bacterium]
MSKETFQDLMERVKSRARGNVTPYDIAYAIRDFGGKTQASSIYTWMKGEHLPRLHPRDFIALLKALELPVTEASILRLTEACEESQRLYKEGVEKASKKAIVPKKRVPKSRRGN